MFSYSQMQFNAIFLRPSFLRHFFVSYFSRVLGKANGMGPRNNLEEQSLCEACPTGSFEYIAPSEE